METGIWLCHTMAVSPWTSFLMSLSMFLEQGYCRNEHRLICGESYSYHMMEFPVRE